MRSLGNVGAAVEIAHVYSPLYCVTSLVCVTCLGRDADGTFGAAALPCSRAGGAADRAGARFPKGFIEEITRQAIRRGSFTWVKDLIAAIEAFIDGWNDRGHPFTWTKTPDELLPRCKPGKRNLVHARWPRH